MGTVTEKAEDSKMFKYFSLYSSRSFMPVAVETCGAFGLKTKSFIQDLEQCLKTPTEGTNYFQ